MTHLPENRTTAATLQEHIDDHNRVHALHNAIEAKGGAVALLSKQEADALYLPVGTVGSVLHNHDISYAPVNHTHPTPSVPQPSDATPRAIGTGNAGSGVAYARWDHVHGQGDHTHPLEAHTHPAGDAATLDGLDSTAFALAGHTHTGGASAVTVQKATADQAVAAATLTNATNMGFAVAANANYEFEYLLAITSAAATTGWQFGFTGPATPAVFVAVCEYQSSATAWTIATLNAVTYGQFPLVTAAYVANAPIVVRVKGIVATGALAGTVQLQVRSEVAGSAITIKRGSTLKVA